MSKVWERRLAVFFRDLKEAGFDQYFHPHSFSDEEAEKLSEYSGKDLYYILVEDDKILGYGMLRGWDKGYDVPSLGIVMHPLVKGEGLGILFMRFLHMAAIRRGAKKIMLKVYPDNVDAVRLYKGLGYKFHAEEDGQLIGFIDL